MLIRVKELQTTSRIDRCLWKGEGDGSGKQREFYPGIVQNPVAGGGHRQEPRTRKSTKGKEGGMKERKGGKFPP